jgi:hypothetical protein
MSEIFLNQSNSEVKEVSLVEQLTLDVAGLLYPSESDERLKIIDWQADHPAPFDIILFKKYIGVPPKQFVEVLPYEKFFEIVLTPKEWWTDYEKQRYEKFLCLKEIIEKNLTDLTYFRAGRNEIEAYLLGKDKDGKWKGLKTIIIET